MKVLEISKKIDMFGVSGIVSGFCGYGGRVVQRMIHVKVR